MRQGKKNYYKVIAERLIQIIGLIILIYLGYLGWQKIFDLHSFPFRHVKIVADENHISTDQIKNIITENIQGGFFSLKERALKNTLLSLPWVNDVSIRRIWPDTLFITLSEQQPIARWNNEAVFNRQGILFSPSMKTVSNDLPLLSGPEEAEQEVFKKFLDLQNQLSPLHLAIHSLQLNDRDFWQMTLSNGVKVVIGNEDIDQRIAKFIELYSQLIGDKASKVGYVDLRYSNGIAIKWKHSKINK